MAFKSLRRRASFYLRSLMLVLLFPAAEEVQARTVIAIGGADRKVPAIDKAIVESVGPDRTICILAAAADDVAEAGQEQARRFKAMGLRPLVVDPATDGELAVRKIRRCAGIYLGGGSQSRLMEVLMPDGEDSPLLAEIRAAVERGVVLVGNSAGTAVLSDPMIYTVEKSGVGLGVVPVALHQHFFARGRFWKLYEMMEEYDLPLGLGIDEGTAVVFGSGDEGTVIGKGHVLLIERPGPGDAGGEVLVSLLAEGDMFRPGTAEIVPAPDREPVAPGAGAREVAVRSGMRTRNAMLNLLLDLARSDAEAAIGLDLPELTPADGSMTVGRFLFRRTGRTRIFGGNDRFTIVRLSLRQDRVPLDLPY